MNIPTPYKDLITAAETLPILREALKLYGIHEKLGADNNPEIMAWAREIGGQVAGIYKADEMPWCGLFAGIVAKRAGFDPPALCIRAMNWAEFGSAVTEPALCDVLVFSREGGGHVGFYVGEDKLTFHVLGGNQGDMVKIMPIDRFRIKACRRPLYDATPNSVKSITRSGIGPASTAMV